jgi:hypothetical protein
LHAKGRERERLSFSLSPVFSGLPSPCMHASIINQQGGRRPRAT